MDHTGVLRTLAAANHGVLYRLLCQFGADFRGQATWNSFSLSHEEYHYWGVLVTLAAIGGFLAVSRTDVFQSLVILSGFSSCCWL